jgi:hypothetical protein
MVHSTVNNSTQVTPSKTKKRTDGQMTGLAGELFVAAELLKRGIQTSVTFGNAKAIDLLAYNPTTKHSYVVQVKSLREKNFFLIGHKQVERSHIYVFVLLNKPGKQVQYFVVPGEHLFSNPDKFSRYFQIEKMPGIHPNVLTNLGYEDKWQVFDAVAA